MIARSDDLGGDLLDAVFVVAHADDEHLLTRLECVVALAGQPSKMSGIISGSLADVVVLVGRVDPGVRDLIRQDHPHVQVLHARAVDSLVQALGYPGPIADDWGDSEVERARSTLGTLMSREARLDTERAVHAEAIEPRRPPERPWPKPMGGAVRAGFVGRFLEVVESETEADPAAMVVDLLVRSGNAVGRGPHFVVSGDRHGCNLNAAIVGSTGQGRKGTSATYPTRLLRRADPDWAATRVLSGLSSGEGLIHAVRDDRDTGRTDKDGNVIVEPGVSDKRLLAVETELGRTFKAGARRESVLMQVLRAAWDGTHLGTITKGDPLHATDPHVSIIGHVTSHELLSLLTSEDLHGGTVNRFLLIASRRQRELAFGGEVDAAAFQGLSIELQRCVEFGKQLGELAFSKLAAECWPGLYTQLSADETAPGIRGVLLARAVPQVRRLAMVFAVLDLSPEVDVRHLDAAAEVWRYHRDTVAHVFGISTGNRIADRILGELSGGRELNRTEMHGMFGRHVTAAQIDEALALLFDLKLAFPRRVAGSGRPREVWSEWPRSSEET